MNPITALLQAMGFGLNQGTALAQAMKGENPNARMQSGPILNEDGTFVGPAGTDLRRGMDDPRVGVGNRGVPMPPPRPALSALTPVADVNAGRVAVAPGPVLAGAMQPDTSPDNMDIGGGDRTPMMAPVSDAVATPVSPQPGIFSRLMDNSKTGVSPMEYLLRGFTAAGSANPAQTMMQFSAQDTENEKIRDARRRANQPKVDQITGTPFFQITYPDGRSAVTSDPQLAAYFKSQSESKVNQAVEKAVLEDRLARGRDATKADTRASEEARPLLNDIQSLKGRWSEAKDIVSAQGIGAQLQGIPVISGIAGFFGGDEVAKNKFLEGLTVDETLLNTARTKGAISNQEMNLFKAPIPSLTDDREKVWKPWIEKRIQVLEKLEKFYQGEVSRGSSATGPNPNAPAPRQQATSTPPPSDQLRAAVTAAGIPFEPEKFEYRFGPNGQIQRKAK